MISEEPTLSSSRAAYVNAMLLADHLLMEPAEQPPSRERAQRDIDEEDPTPVQEVDEETAKRGSDDSRERPDAGDVALNPSAFGD